MAIYVALELLDGCSSLLEAGMGELEVGRGGGVGRGRARHLCGAAPVATVWGLAGSATGMASVLWTTSSTGRAGRLWQALAQASAAAMG